MSRRWLYTAKIAPIGKPFRIPGDEGVPVLLDTSSFALERQRPWLTPVHLHHDRAKKIGALSDLRPGNEWWLADILLDPALSAELQVGQAVSVGIATMRASGNHILSELSVVQKGAVKGAEIISRLEIKSARPAEERIERLAADREQAPSGWSVIYDESGRELSRQPQQTVTRYFPTKITVDGGSVGRRGGGMSPEVVRRIQALPDDGFSTFYDKYGNEISRTRLAVR